MAFDGIVIANLVRDLNTVALNGRISKIAQPETDELLFTIKGTTGQIRLVLSANASLPLVYLTDQNKQSPMTAPNFCMLLRKYIANGKIVKIFQPDMERIICFEIEHFDDMGDLCTKFLYVEIMGKHSNLIFCDSQNIIIDSIKHISAQVSSVREVLPGRTYFIPKTQEKFNPINAAKELFFDEVYSKPTPIFKAIYSTFTGISPLIASEICTRADIDANTPANCLEENEKLHLYHHFTLLMDDVAADHFEPNMIYRGKEPIEFSSVLLTQYKDYDVLKAASISEVLQSFYASKDLYSRIRQKSVDLRKIVATDLDRTRRKYDLQLKQLKDTQKREKYKIYGELINTYGYNSPEGSKKLEALNYYTNEMITIPLDPQLSVQENSQKYFEKYNKLKRTFEALETLTLETKAEMDHLDSISAALDIAVSEADLSQIKEELVEYGYIKKHTKSKQKRSIKSKPFHYVSRDGFDIYVGKNNLQNDELTFKVANGNDWWFHAKGMPGSHVIVKTNGEKMTDQAFEEASALAAYYSRGRDSKKVEIDYLQRKNVKKPNGSKAGFVVYYTNYSLSIAPDITGFHQIDER